MYPHILILLVINNATLARHWEGVPDSRHRVRVRGQIQPMQSQRGLDVSDRRGPPLQSASCLCGRPAFFGLIHRLHTLEHAQRCCSRPWEGVPVVTDSQSKFLTDAGTPFHFSRPDMSGLTGAISSPSLLVTLVGDSGLPFHSSGLHWLPTQRPRDRSTHFGITRGRSRTHDLRPSGLQGGDATD